MIVVVMYLPPHRCGLTARWAVPTTQFSAHSSQLRSANFTQLALDICHVNNSPETTSLSPFLARFVTLNTINKIIPSYRKNGS